MASASVRVDQLHRAKGGDEVFVRGMVRYADHETIVLDVWHRVVQNVEVTPGDVAQRSENLQRIAWLDGSIDFGSCLFREARTLDGGRGVRGGHACL